MHNEQRVGKVITLIAVVVAVTVALAFPLGYFSVSYQYFMGNMDAEAEMTSHILTALINDNPEMWVYEQRRLEELLQRRMTNRKEARRILDLQNKVVAEVTPVLESPLITRTFDLRDAGLVVGKLEIRASLLPLIINSGLALLQGVVFGLAIFFVLRSLPLRALARAEKSLRESEDRYRSLVENAPNAIIVHDNEMFLYANRLALQLFGVDRVDQITGQPFQSIIHLDNREMLDLFQFSEYESTKEVKKELRFVRVDSTIIEAVAVGVRITYKGQPAVQTILHDITEIKNLQDELSDKVAKLEAALANVKLLEGIIPICAYCKKIRDDVKSWHQLEKYISNHSEAKFSHGICPECFEIQSGEIKKLKK